MKIFSQKSGASEPRRCGHARFLAWPKYLGASAGSEMLKGGGLGSPLIERLRENAFASGFVKASNSTDCSVIWSRSST